MARHAVLDPAQLAAPAAVGHSASEHAVPRMAEGVELVGPYHGSGYREPKYLVSRADDQVIQLPRLLHLLASAIDGHRDVEQIAAELSTEADLDIDRDRVAYLIAHKLRPAGIVAADGEGPAVPVATPQPDPLLMLRFRLPVVPRHAVWRIAGFFAPAFRPAVIAVAMAAFVAVDVAVLAAGGLAAVAPSTIALFDAPALALLVIVALLGSAVFHESGHVAACRYGGARPGAMGVGIYLVWPAFYSTVTDSYRLTRAGRLRTDLGGVYFNAIFMAGLGGAWPATGTPWLLLALLALHVETVRQFLPSIRLDGYYILSDLIGLPGLFMFLRPVLSGVLPGRPRHPRVAELKARVRQIIVVWVLLVIPFLLSFLVLFLALAPQVLPALWAELVERVATIGGAVRGGDGDLATLNWCRSCSCCSPFVFSRTNPTRPRQSRAVLATVLVAVGLAAGPLVAGASALDPDRHRLSAWTAAQLDPGAVVAAAPLVAAQLIADGMPAGRIVPVGDPSAQVSVLAGGSDAGGTELLSLPGGVGAGPITVRRPTGNAISGPAVGPLLADNSNLTLSDPAERALRADLVDPRLTATLAGLAGVYHLTITGFPAVEGEPAGAPRRIALVAAVVPSSRARS